jgi:hypothetical protein
MVIVVSFCVVLWQFRRWPQDGRDTSVGSPYWTDIGEQRSGFGKTRHQCPEKVVSRWLRVENCELKEQISAF